jgi:hypothetical protein
MVIAAIVAKAIPAASLEQAKERQFLVSNSTIFEPPGTNCPPL